MTTLMCAGLPAPKWAAWDRRSWRLTELTDQVAQPERVQSNADRVSIKCVFILVQLNSDSHF